MYHFDSHQYQPQEVVDLNDQSITDVSLESRLNQYSQLQIYKMNLKDNPITNVKPITQFQMLRYLDLSGTNIENVSDLSKLTNLEVLYLNTTHIKDLSFLKSLKKLRELYLTDSPITDIEPLSDLSELKILSLAGTNIDKNISVLSRLSNLVEVYLMNTKIDDESLGSLKQLRNLNNLFVDDELESTKNYILSEVKRKRSETSYSVVQNKHQTSNISGQVAIPRVQENANQALSLDQIKELISRLNDADKTSLKEWFNSSHGSRPQVSV